MRMSRMAALGASMLVLLSACSTGGGATQTPTNTASGTPTAATSTPPAATPTTAAATIASTLILGGPPECPQRPFCLLGLQETYGLSFKEFKPLDVGGPLTVAALEGDEIQVGLLFSSDPTVADKGFVVLEDDLALQNAENLTPVVNSATLTEFPEIGDILNVVSAKVTQDELNAMNKRLSGEEKADADVVASEWLSDQSLLSGEGGGTKGPITVGKTNFYEQDVLSEIYAQVLEDNGFDVSIAEASGARETVFPTLTSGDIDVLPEYLASALEYVNGGAGQATGDAEETAGLFRTAAESIGLTVLDPAPATDSNVFVVTPATAAQYSLATISDLGNPLP